MNPKISAYIYFVLSVIAFPISLFVSIMIDTRPEGFNVDRNVAAIIEFSYILTVICAIYSYRMLGKFKNRDWINKTSRVILSIVLGLCMAGILGFAFMGFFAVFSLLFWILLILILPIIVSVGNRCIHILNTK
jgi:hypothetical protein